MSQSTITTPQDTTADCAFTVTQNVTYYRSETPPRCRKARNVPYHVTVTTPIPRLDASQAPVAFRWNGRWWSDPGNRRTMEVRTHQGRLYAPHYRYDGTATIPGSDDFPAVLAAIKDEPALPQALFFYDWAAPFADAVHRRRQLLCRPALNQNTDRQLGGSLAASSGEFVRLF